MKTLQIGKLDPEILETLLSRYTKKDERVRIGAGIGEDAAVIDMGPVLLVAKTDPITHAGREIGHYAVQINANDIAAMGGTPKWYLATILMTKTAALEATAIIANEKIGKMMNKKEGMHLVKSGEVLPLPLFHQDELSKLFG